MIKDKYPLDKSNYPQLLEEIKSILQNGLGRAYQAVDNIKVQTYWQIGERIVREEIQHQERAEYGQKRVEMLARDLEFSRRLMFEIIDFYRTYPIVHTLRAQLSWTHYRWLMQIKNNEERQFYETQSILNVWSTRELEQRIKEREYHNIKKEKQLIVKLPPQLPSLENIFKDVYHWNFLELEDNYSEKLLEKALVDNIQKILLEFGHGFAFMGAQQKILIAGQWHKVDLVFFHRLLKCVILVELKTEKFKSEFVGQINKYLTYFRENKLQDERDPIGLIICKEKDDEEVHYALGKLNEDIFVSEYKTYLPSEEEIKKRLKMVRR